MNPREFLRFAVVGLVQNGTNVAAFALMVAGGVDYRLAAVGSATVALLTSYWGNGRWTFAAAPRSDGYRLVRYSAVFVLATVIGLGLLTALNELAGWRPVPAQIASILVVAPLSYFAQREFTFRV